MVVYYVVAMLVQLYGVYYVTAREQAKLGGRSPNRHVRIHATELCYIDSAFDLLEVCCESIGAPLVHKSMDISRSCLARTGHVSPRSTYDLLGPSIPVGISDIAT